MFPRVHWGINGPESNFSKTIPMPKKNILIADDESAIRSLLEKLLRDERHRLFFASDGEEAVRFAKMHPMDLAVLDMVMPRMGGLEAIKEIKAIDEHTEVLIITGNAELGSLNEALFDYGAVDYLIKPFDLVELKLTVKRALHNRDLMLRNTHENEELRNRIMELEQDFREKTFRLRDSQIKYKNIVSNSTDAIVVIQEGLLKFVNIRGVELIGFFHHELMNVPFTDLLHPEDRSEAMERYHRRMAGEHLPPENKFRIIKKDGSFLWVDNRTVKTTWQDRPATLNFLRDISQQKRMEEMMIRSEKMASLGQLSAGLAHELRNPLAVISSCAQFCVENMDLERLVAENFQVIHRNSQKASKLISELLAFARPDSLNYKPMELNQLFERMLRMAKLEMDPSHLTFEKRFEAGLPEIPGDEEKLGQVCLNLIQNAIQAVSGKGIITVETRWDRTGEPMLELSVADNGPGIPLEHRNRIFDPFFTTKNSGTGLGLSICHAVVEQHHGEISFECGEKGGTRMAVKLPIKNEKVTEHPHEQ